MVRKAIRGEYVTASGPYSHAIDSEQYVFLSGQTAMNSQSIKENLKGNIAEQTKECFKNLSEVLKAANLTFDDVVKVNVYLTDMKHFNEMNEVYKTMFNGPYPARTCIAVLALPLGAEVEIEMIAKRS